MNLNNCLFPCPHLNIYFTDITLLLSIYEFKNPRTWKSICLKCNDARSRMLLHTLVVPDSCICSRKLSYVNVIVYLFKKFINNSGGKYKRNECLINVCKSDKDLS
jgi:hypothetical protein